MIIDIRYNGGGNIDQQLIDILERKPYEYWNYSRIGQRFWSSAAAGDCRAKGHVDQLAIRFRQ